MTALMRGLSVALCTVGLWACGERAPDVQAEREPVRVEGRDADLIVVGAGVAGLSTALEAASLDKTVLVVEMASVFGGHAILSGGGVSLSGTPLQDSLGIADSPELHYEDMRAWGGDVDERWARRYTADSAEVFDWLTSHGVGFEIVRGPPGNSVRRMHFPRDQGLGLVLPLIEAVLGEDRIRFAFHNRVDEILLEDGVVRGVRATQVRTGEEVRLAARAVVIATGGFQSDLERVRRHWPEGVAYPDRILAGSGVNSLGSGLDLATAAGSGLHRMEHMWNYITGVPDPDDASGDRGLSLFIPGGEPRQDIWVNAEGERFINECLSAKHAFAAVLAQPGGAHWLVVDAAGLEHVTVSGSGWTRERIHSEIFDNRELTKSAESLEELAEQAGLPPGRLAASVARFNTFLREGRDADFGRFGESDNPGCPTTAPIETPPFYAIQRYPLARKSLGGIVIDQDARVIDVDGAPINGLYAAGEVTGFAGVNGGAGLEGTFLGPSIYTGWIAARTASDELARFEAVSWPLAEPEPPPATIGAELPCQNCHRIEADIATPRWGYRHFEAVHTRVLDRELPCAACHADMSPYRPTTHHLDRTALTSTCIICHGRGGD